MATINPMILQLMGMLPNQPVDAGPAQLPGNPLMPQGGAPVPQQTAVPQPQQQLGVPNVQGGNLGGTFQELMDILQESPPFTPAPQGPQRTEAKPIPQVPFGSIVPELNNPVVQQPLGPTAMPTPGNRNPALPPARVPPMLPGQNTPGLPGLPLGPDAAGASTPETSAPGAPPNVAAPQPLGTPASPGAAPTAPGQPAPQNVPQPPPAAAAREALRAVQDPDGVAAEQAAAGTEPPPLPGQTPEEGVGGQLAAMNDALAAVQPVEGPPQMPAVNPGSGTGGQVNPRLFEMLMSMQQPQQVGPSLAELLARI